MAVRATILCVLFATEAQAAPPEVVHPEILGVRAHDTRAYTQGLLLADGLLYESAGGYSTDGIGPSTLREVDPSTGQIKRSVTLDGGFFGEGLAKVGDRLIQLTWREGVALVWDLASFHEVGRYSYSGQGWGLCFDGTRLVMSNGSSRLTFRDPADFSVLGHIDVTLEEPAGTINRVGYLNELECVGNHIYANLYTYGPENHWILEIDAGTGRVTRRLETPDLLTDQEAATADVQNGIAYDSATGHFLLTGKHWPKLFEVTFDGQGPSPVGRTSRKGCTATASNWLAALSPLGVLALVAIGVRRWRTRR